MEREELEELKKLLKKLRKKVHADEASPYAYEEEIEDVINTVEMYLNE